MKTREFNVSKKKAVVVDDAFNKIEMSKIELVLNNQPLKRHGSTHAEKITLHYCAQNTNLDILKKTFLTKTINPILKKKFKLKSPTCNRIVYREIVYGDHLDYHTDCKTNEKAVTAILYMNSEWTKNNKGETLLLEDDEDAGVFITPQMGRLLLFDSLIVHSSTTPSRLCYDARKILVLNFIDG